MKRINKEEVFGNVKSFLSSRGIELQDGLYTQRIVKCCEVLADTANVSQKALKDTKAVVGRGLDHVRQVIHEKTAPAPPPQPKTENKKKNSQPRAQKQPPARPAQKPSKKAPKAR